MDWKTVFSKQGFATVPAVNREPLNEIRHFICEQAKLCFNLSHIKENDPEKFLNEFHKYGISDANLNAQKLQLIEACNQRSDFGRLLYEAFSTYIDTLLGPDLLVQRNANIILFPPNYQHYSEPHRDAPQNSSFELVFWVPLNRCYGTKTLYMLNLEQTKNSLSLLSEQESFEQFECFCRTQGQYLEAEFGEACFFWPGLAHGSGVNLEDETRWTLNIRFKNAYSPDGGKDSLQFFDILHLSPVTRFGIALEKELHFNPSPLYTSSKSSDRAESVLSTL